MQAKLDGGLSFKDLLYLKQSQPRGHLHGKSSFAQKI